MDLALFQVSWKDIQVGVANGLANGAHATSKGFELTSSYAASRGLHLAYNAAYTRAALDSEHLFHNRDNDDVAFFWNGGNHIDRLAYGYTVDLSCLASKQFVNQLLALVSDPRDLNPAGFNLLLRDRNFLRREGDNLGNLIVGARTHAIQPLAAQRAQRLGSFADQDKTLAFVAIG